MARKSRLLHLGSAHYEGPVPEFSPSDEEWKSIAGDYCNLTADDRRALAEIVRKYLTHRPFESGAAPVKDVAKRLREIWEAAHRLYVLLDEDSEVGAAASERLAARLVIDCGASHAPDSLAAAIMVAARFAKAAVENGGPGIEAHDAWRRFARSVMVWAKETGRDATISNPVDAEDKGKRGSPFVLFFWRLQAAMPKEAIEFQRSYASLAKALNRARLGQ